jgi:hypothetical protein
LNFNLGGVVEDMKERNTWNKMKNEFKGRKFSV